MEAKGRVELCQTAQIAVDAAREAWTDLAEETRAALRRAMVHGERLDMSLVEWVGTVEFAPGTGYWVDLIPGNNFSGSGQVKGITPQAGGHFRGGAPPGYH